MIEALCTAADGFHARATGSTRCSSPSKVAVYMCHLLGTSRGRLVHCGRLAVMVLRCGFSIMAARCGVGLELFDEAGLASTGLNGFSRQRRCQAACGKGPLHR